MIDFEVKLFDVTGLAADGSNIPRRSCEEYLASTDYQTIIRDKVALGGVTHKDRKLTPEYKGLIGMDDLLLVNDNVTHYITGLYFKSGDNFLYASARTFDPSKFAGKRADNIQNLIGMLSTGVRMPISVVIQALWSKRGTAEKIIRIKGFDYTQNPSFKGAGDVQIFSDTSPEQYSLKLPEDISKQFSDSLGNGELVAQTRVFSSTGEVTILDDAVPNSNFSELDDVMTYKDAVSKYGMFSPQALKAKGVSNQSLQKSDLQSILANSDSTESKAKKVDSVAGSDTPTAIDSLHKQKRSKLPSILSSVPDSDPNKNNLIDSRLDEYFETTPNKEYSLVQSIASRILNEKQSYYIKLNRLVNGYETYLDTIKLTPRTLEDLKRLWIQDLNLLIKDSLPKIIEGRDFNSIYGLSRFGLELVNPSNKLSLSYRKLLLSTKVLGFIPKQVYITWRSDLINFYNIFTLKVFGSDLPEFPVDLIDLK